MNKPQKIVISITLILVGCIWIMYIALTQTFMPTSAWGEPEFAISFPLFVILGIVLIAGGLVVLFSKTKR